MAQPQTQCERRSSCYGDESCGVCCRPKGGSGYHHFFFLNVYSFSTFIEFYEKRDVGLMSVVLRYILMDGCAAGRLAAEKARWGQGK